MCNTQHHNSVFQGRFSEGSLGSIELQVSANASLNWGNGGSETQAASPTST